VREVLTIDNELGIKLALQLILNQPDTYVTRFATLRNLPDLDSRLRMGNEFTVFRTHTAADDPNQLRRDSKNYFRYYVDPLPNHKVLFISQ
jgi:hypothetical protein